MYHQETMPSATITDPRPTLPSFVRDRLPAIRAACDKYNVQALYLYGSAVTGAYKPGESDLDFVAEFTPEARTQYEGPPEHCFRGILPSEGGGSAYPPNYRGLTAALTDIFTDYLTQVGGRAPIDVCIYSDITNKYVKEQVNSEKVKLYARP